MKALLINPYIYDFAAYSFWSSPLGLLYVGAILRQNVMDVTLIDCMVTVREKRKADGRAPFLKAPASRPLPGLLAATRKRLKRYGISEDQLRERLLAIDAPDLILITSIMTYWYQGAEEVAAIARDVFPRSKIIMGGIYPSLCYEHALTHMPGADLILRHHEIAKLYAYIEEVFSLPLSFTPSIYDLDLLPYPAFDLYGDIPFVPLLTSYGCAFKCSYCATPFMHPRIVRRDAAHVIGEIRHWHGLGVGRYVFYDDNLLYRAELYAKPLLSSIARLPFPIDIYNPNAVNAAFIDAETARLMGAAGFREVRLGFETADPDLQRATGGKVNIAAFERALGHLSRAGFGMERLGVYVLAGLPNQTAESVRQSIDYLAPLGVRIHIAEYTPIPHTPLFDQHQSSARYPIAEDPLYQNNALFPFAWEGFTDADLSALKFHVKHLNERLHK